MSGSDREAIRDIAFSMEGALSDLENTITALQHSVGVFAELPGRNNEPGDLDYYVADALAHKLAHDHRSIREKWQRLFEHMRHTD